MVEETNLEQRHSKMNLMSQEMLLKLKQEKLAARKALNEILQDAEIVP